jgi:hypothetical protein
MDVELNWPIVVDFGLNGLNDYFWIYRSYLFWIVFKFIVEAEFTLDLSFLLFWYLYSNNLLCVFFYFGI